MNTVPDQPPDRDITTSRDSELTTDRATTIDAFLGGALEIEQPARGYRAGLDAVLLAAAADIAPDPSIRVADLGSGVGTVGQCLAKRVTNIRVCLIEQDIWLAQLAQQNIVRNELAQRMKSINHGVGAGPLPKELPTHGFDHVLANPPYFDAPQSRAPSNRLRSDANIMPENGLETWARFTARLLKPGGQLTWIYPAARLGDVINAFAGRFGALKIKPVHPRENERANRILVRGVKGSRGALELLPPVIVHDVSGALKPPLKYICSSPAALKW